MPAAKEPVPYCAHNHPQQVEDGTLCRAPSPPPVPTGTGTAGQATAGTSSQAGNARFTPSGPSIVSRIQAAPNGSELRRWAEAALGPTSFSLGVCWGMLGSVGGSAVELLDLLKTFLLAGLYERAQQPLGWWDVADMPGQLAARAAQLAYGTDLRRAHDRCDALLTELKYAVAHPRELFGSLKGQYVAKWKRFERLSGDISLSGQFEAGKIAGEVLVDVIMLIGVGEAAVKLAAKLPELAKLAESVGESLRLGSRAGASGGAAVEEAEAAAAGAGRASVTRSPPRVEPPLPKSPIELAKAIRDAPQGSAERRALVNDFAKNSCTHVKEPATRVVLGEYKEGGGYVAEAEAQGGVYYKTPDGAYKVLGKEAAWETNQAFLTQQMEAGVPKIEFTGMDVDAELAKFSDTPPQATPARIKEIQFLQENAGNYGYVQQGNSFVKVR